MNTELFGAVKIGDALAVEVWLKKNRNDVAASDDTGHSMLHWACKLAHHNLFRFLIGQPNVQQVIESRNDIGDTPIICAAQKGDMQILEKLIKVGANVNSWNDHGNTPLHYACFYRRMDVVHALLVAGAHPNRLNKYGKVPLTNKDPDFVAEVTALCKDLQLPMDRMPFDGPQDIVHRKRERLFRDLTHNGMSSTLLPASAIETKHVVAGNAFAGAFSNVHHCRWKAQDLCVREFCGVTIADALQKDILIEEIDLLRISNFEMLRPVLGAVVECPDTLKLVIENQPCGTLRQFFERNPNGATQVDPVKYLLALVKGIVHLLEADFPHNGTFILSSSSILLDDDMKPQIDLSCTVLDRIRPRPFIITDVEFVPPEMLTGGLDRQKNDPGASFMYALGMIAVELASGKPPFYATEGCGNVFVAGSKVADDGVIPTMPEGMENAVARVAKLCLNPEPVKRPNPARLIPILTKLGAT